MPTKNLGAVFAALPTSLVILEADSPNFRVAEVNRSFLELSGRERSDFLEKPFFSTIRAFVPDRFKANVEKLESLANEVLDKKMARESDIYQLHLNESSKVDSNKNQYLQFKFSLVFEDGDTVDSFVIAVEDVTDLLTKKEKDASETKRISTRKELHSHHKDLLARAEKSEAQFESASKELDDFVYSVSHDLRAPLRRIDGFSQELMNSYADQLDENGKHYLKRVRQGAQDMGNLIDDLLKLSRISRKKVEKEPVDLGEIATNVFEELIELENEREISFEVEEHLTARADKGLMKVMFLNLISNALKFSSREDKTKIKVGSNLTDGNPIYYISDNGVGFNSIYNHKLFKAFSRLHSHKEFEGTGIGLATVKRIVTSHGGTVWAESSEGEGATFYFKF